MVCKRMVTFLHQPLPLVPLTRCTVLLVEVLVLIILKPMEGLAGLDLGNMPLLPLAGTEALVVSIPLAMEPQEVRELDLAMAAGEALRLRELLDLLGEMEALEHSLGVVAAAAGRLTQPQPPMVEQVALAVAAGA
jgi:hypothetical protein